MEREIRKLQNSLIVTGTGIILFTIWSAIRSMASYSMSISGSLEPDKETIVLIVYIALLCIDILLRCFTGLKARAAGHKKNGSISYIFTAAILILIHAISITIYLFLSPLSLDSVLDTVISCIIELTGIIMSAELIYSGLRLRKLLHTEERQEA